MAIVVLKSATHYKRTTIVVLGLLSLLMLIHEGDAYEFKVGGSGDWSLSSTNYNEWAEGSRFQIGDTVLFNYQADNDAVLEVNKDDYDNCNTASPIAKYSDGHSVIKFNNSGPHYFISGEVDKCKKNEKVAIVVMADRSNKNTPPSPAPAGEESPSPPPAPSTEESQPTPAPSEENSPPSTPNSASSVLMSFIGSIGAFAGSSILFVL